MAMASDLGSWGGFGHSDLILVGLQRLPGQNGVILSVVRRYRRVKKVGFARDNDCLQGLVDIGVRGLFYMGRYMSVDEYVVNERNPYPITSSLHPSSQGRKSRMLRRGHRSPFPWLVTHSEALGQSRPRHPFERRPPPIPDQHSICRSR